METVKEKGLMESGPQVEDPARPSTAQTVTATEKPLHHAAGQIRENAELGQDVLVSVEGSEFVLRFDQDLYFSAVAVGDLSKKLVANPRCNASVEPIGLVPKKPGWRSRPLADFLWQFAILAGGGRLLPWLSSAAAYRLVEEPRTELATRYESLLRTIRSEGRSPLMISQDTDASLPEVYDLLNACSLSGCLKIAAPLSIDGIANPLSELTLQGPLPSGGPELEPLQKGLMNLLSALRGLEQDSDTD